jgi:hypothetical protein
MKFGHSMGHPAPQHAQSKPPNYTHVRVIGQVNGVNYTRIEAPANGTLKSPQTGRVK